jgi:hypothetical protein
MNRSVGASLYVCNILVREMQAESSKTYRYIRANSGVVSPGA